MRGAARPVDSSWSISISGSSTVDARPLPSVAIVMIISLGRLHSCLLFSLAVAVLTLPGFVWYVCQLSPAGERESAEAYEVIQCTEVARPPS